MNNNEYILQDVYNGVRFNRKKTMSVETFVRREAEGKFNIPALTDKGRDFSNVIWAVLNNYPLPAFYIKSTEDSFVTEMLTTSVPLSYLKSFVSNLCAMPERSYEIPCVFKTISNDEKIFMYDISGKYFKDLPETLQNKILWYNLDFVELKNYKSEDLDIFRDIPMYLI